VHLQIYMEVHYLAAIAEDSWFEREEAARLIANRIGDVRRHYSSNTVLGNAEAAYEEIEKQCSKEAQAYRAIFDDDALGELIDLSAARRNIRQYESKIVSGAWVGANRRFPIGSIHRKMIVNNVQFGVFVALEPDLQGLIHSSKLPADFRTNDAFRRGEEVRVRVLDIDRVERRMELEWISNLNS